MRPCTLFQFTLLILTFAVHFPETHGTEKNCDGKNLEISEEDLSRLVGRHFTDKQIVSSDSIPVECPSRVRQEREKYKDGNSQTIGIVPTVSFGTAIAIFVSVGIFAAIIAQCFQMVRNYYSCKQG